MKNLTTQLILQQRGNELLAFVFSKMAGTRQILFEKSYEQSFGEDSEENILKILQNLNEDLQEKKIKKPEKVYVFLKLENLIIKKWSLPFKTKNNAKKALKHLLKRDIPLPEDKISHSFFFQAKPRKMPRIIFSYTMRKSQIFLWENVFKSMNYPLTCLSFTPFLFMDIFGAEQEIFLYQEENCSLLIYGNNKQIQEIKLLPHDGLPAKTSAEFLNILLREQEQYFNEARNIFYYSILPDYGQILTRLKEKFSINCIALALENIQPKKSGFGTLSNKLGQNKRFNLALSHSKYDFTEELIHRIEEQFSIFKTIKPNFLTLKPLQSHVKSPLSKFFVPCLAIIISLSLYNILLSSQNSELQRSIMQNQSQLDLLFKREVQNISRKLSTREMKSIIQGRIQEGAGDEQNLFVLQILNGLSLAASPEMELSLVRFGYNQNNSSLYGFVKNFDMLKLYMENINQEMPVTSVEIISATPQVSQRISFELRLQHQE